MRTRGATTSGSHLPLWLAGARLPAYGSLPGSLEADVCVVGAGVAGLTTALLLRSEGREVVVLEDGRIGSGETGRTTAHLTVALDTRYHRLEELHGEGGARLAAESHASAIDRIEALVAEERIACGFARVSGYLFAAREDDVADLEREQEAAGRMGLADVALVPRVPGRGWDSGPALRFPRQARLDPVRYVAGLARAFVRRGGRIFCGTHVEAIAPGRPARVVTRQGEVAASFVVVATNAPVSDRFRLPTKQFAYRTYVVGFPAPRGGPGDDLLWDTAEPYHFVRTARKGTRRLLLVGGEDHRTGQEDDPKERFERLARWTRARFPVTGAPVCEWSGQVMEPIDGLAYIGRDPEDEVGNVYVATGQSGNGMTYGMIAGAILTDEIEGRRSPWGAIYDPARTSLRATAAWAAENLGIVPEYAGWLTGGDVESAAAIRRGEGGVLRKGLGKVALYRDEKGALHERSAVCPHLGCLVHWNDAEKSWDCPCHGSRFDARGTVVNGPASADLGAHE